MTIASIYNTRAQSFLASTRSAPTVPASAKVLASPTSSTAATTILASPTGTLEAILFPHRLQLRLSQ